MNPLSRDSTTLHLAGAVNVYIDVLIQVNYKSVDYTTEHSGHSTLSQHQKFQKAKLIVDKLPSLASEVGMDEFMRRMDTLKKVYDAWAHGGSVIVLMKMMREFNNCTMSVNCKYIRLKIHKILGRESIQCCQNALRIGVTSYLA